MKIEYAALAAFLLFIFWFDWQSAKPIIDENLPLPKNADSLPPGQKLAAVSPPDSQGFSKNYSKNTNPKINGLTCVAPPAPFESNPMLPMRAIGANWVAVVPYAFTKPGVPKVFYKPKGQWWGEGIEGVKKTTALAHETGLKVMLKPQVWMPGAWVGALIFENEKDNEQWEQEYERYILPMAQLADSLQVEMLCIGTEFCQLTARRPDFWKKLIQKIRKVYSGKLTYSSNWDDWERVPFWSELDYVGLGGYFPLVEKQTPTVEELVAAWQPVVERLENFSRATGKPILFSEYGYLTTDFCGWRNWELENGIQSRPVNQQAQANCIEALHTVFQQKQWWAGGFLWKWFPEGQGHEGYFQHDYTPQGKLSEQVLARFFR